MVLSHLVCTRERALPRNLPGGAAARVPGDSVGDLRRAKDFPPTPHLLTWVRSVPTRADHVADLTQLSGFGGFQFSICEDEGDHGGGTFAHEDREAGRRGGGAEALPQ